MGKREEEFRKSLKTIPVRLSVVQQFLSKCEFSTGQLVKGDHIQEKSSISCRAGRWGTIRKYREGTAYVDWDGSMTDWTRCEIRNYERVESQQFDPTKQIFWEVRRRMATRSHSNRRDSPVMP